MKAYEIIGIIKEAPLPPDWDQSVFTQKSTFEQRLKYALERAAKLGTGSSRVATTIEYEGRQTVLKIAKNQKGLAQNNVEADILSDNYAKQLGILIPIIDFDTANQMPMWIHTELAEHATERKLTHALGLSIDITVELAEAMLGLGRFRQHAEAEKLHNHVRETYGEDKFNQAIEYANKIAELANSFDVVLADMTNSMNWGIYNGHPVVIDVGLNSNVQKQYYK